MNAIAPQARVAPEVNVPARRVALVAPVALTVGVVLLAMAELLTRGTVRVSGASLWTTISGTALAGAMLLLPLALLIFALVRPVARLARRHRRWLVPAFRAGYLFAYVATVWWVGLRMVLPFFHLGQPPRLLYRGGYVAILVGVALYARLRGARTLRIPPEAHLGVASAAAWWFHIEAGQNIYQPHVYRLHLLVGAIAFLLAAAAITTYLVRRPPSRATTRACLAVAVAVVAIGATFPARWAHGFGQRHTLVAGSNVGRNAGRIVREVLYYDGLAEIAGRADPAPDEEFRDDAAPPRALGDALAATRPRNLLLVSIDTLRSDALRPELPHFSRLRAESVSFDRFIAAAPITRWALRAIVAGMHVDERAPAHTLAELLKARGLATFHVSTFPSLVRDPIVRRGFDVVDESLVGLFNAPVSAPQTTDAFLRHLAAAGDRPFFGWVHYLDPHAPYDGEGWAARTRYDGEVARVDVELGRLLAALEQAGRLEETLIVVVADHGEEFGDHGGEHHGQTLYEEVIRVPLFVRAPGGKVTGRVATPVTGLDLGPTLLALLGVERPAEFAPGGLDAFDAPAGRPMVVHIPTRQVGIIHGRWKLVFHRRFGAAELYDLKADPAERHNLVDERPDVAAALARRLAAATKS